MAGRAAVVAAVLAALVGYASAKSMQCWSRGDTHMMTFEGKRFDAMGTHFWRLTKTSDNFLEVQVDQKPWVQGDDRITVDRSVAVRCGPFLYEGKVEDKKVPAVISVNKVALTLKKGENRVFESAATPARPYSTLLRVSATTVAGSVHALSVDCEAKRDGTDPTVIAIDMVHRRPSLVYTDVTITVKQSPYKDGDFTGLCGMSSDAEDNAIRANNCYGNKWYSEACRKIAVVQDHENLMKDVSFQVKAAKAGELKVDADRLSKKREHCMGLLEKVVPHLESVPPLLRRELMDTVADCAYDTYFGLPASTDTMKAAMCEYGQNQMDIMRFKAAEQYRELRCLFSYQKALAMTGKSDMDSLNAEVDSVMSAIACTQSTVDEFCFEGCDCKPTEGVDGAMAAQPCGAEKGGAASTEDDAGAPPALLQAAEDTRLRLN